MLNESQNEFKQKVLEAAKSVNEKFGVIITGQAVQSCVESAWGSRMPEFNCFGIKKHTCPYTIGEQYIVTHEELNHVKELETLPFASYKSLEDCFSCHALLLQKNFPSAYSAKNFTDYVNSLMKDPITHLSYATDHTYAELLTSVYKSHFIDLDEKGND